LITESEIAMKVCHLSGTKTCW